MHIDLLRGIVTSALAIALAAPALAIPKRDGNPPPPAEPKATPRATATPIVGGPPATGERVPGTPAPATPTPAVKIGAAITLPKLPLTAHRFSSIPGTGGQLDTNVSIDGSGLLTATTKTHEMTMLTGFDGVLTVLFGDDQNVIWASEPQVYTVASRAEQLLYGKPTDRTDTFTVRMSAEVLARVRRIAIIHGVLSRHGQSTDPGGGGMGIIHVFRRFSLFIPAAGAPIENHPEPQINTAGGAALSGYTYDWAGKKTYTPTATDQKTMAALEAEFGWGQSLLQSLLSGK